MVIKINYTSSDIYVSTNVSPVYVVVNYSGTSGGGGAVWGDITGTLSDQTDLQDALDDKVPYTGATGNVNLGEYELKAGQLTLDTSPTGTAAVGTTRWNDTIGSSETTLKGGSVILKNGVDLVARVVNKVTPNATLTKAAYQAVRVSGAQGQRLAVAYAQANNDSNSADTIGLVTETIPTNQEGFIITMGQIENINTTGSLQGETWVDGDVLYLSPTTPGAITKVKPTGNGHIVVIGYVEYAHANNGKIYVKVMNGWELDELHDVAIVGAANNEALIYESSTQLWKNKTIATALGFTPVPSTRTLTINGTTQDLSADRTFTVSSTNIYNTDGTLAGDRIVTNSTFLLKFVGGKEIISNEQTALRLETSTTGKELIFSLNNLSGKNYLLRSLQSGTFDIRNITDNATVLSINSSFEATFLGVIKCSGDTTIGNNSSIRGIWFNKPTPSTSNYSLYAEATATYINGAGGGIWFRNNNANQGVLTSAGRLLLGTTTEATYLLDVNGTTRVSGALTISGGSFVANSLYYSPQYGLVVAGGTGSSSDLTLTDRGGGLRLQIVNGGNIIQTASVIGNVSIGVAGLFNSNITKDPTYGLQFWGHNTASSYAISMYGDGGSNGLLIATNGNVIIGAYNATNAGYKLDVNGTARVSGQVFSSKVINSATISNSPADASFLLYAPTTTNYYGGIIGWADGNLAASISSYDDGSGGALGLSFATGNNTSISERVKISSSGNLGLGVQPSAWNLSGKVIQIGGNGTSALENYAGIALNISQNAYRPLGLTTHYYTTTDAASNYFQYNGGHAWQIAPFGTAGNAITFTQAMTLTSGGNLLVGTTTDNGARLQVNGSGFFGQTLDALNLRAYNGGSLFLRNPANTFDWAIYNDSSNTIKFDFNAATRLTISSTGVATFSGTLQTGTPTGGTARPWKLGQYNATAPSATGYVEVEINGVLYKLLAST